MLFEKTQRRLCRLLFFLGCVLPTLAVAGFTADRWRPSFTERLLQSAGERLGAEIACQSVSTPRPGVYELRDVSLSEPTTGRDFLTCRYLRVTPVDHGARVAAEGVSLRRPADAWLLRAIGSNVVANGEIDSLTIDSQRVAKASFTLGASNGKRQLKFKTPEGASVEAALDGAVCRVEANTASLALPAAWLSTPFSRLLSGGEATFSGTVTASVPVDGAPSTGEAAGQLTAKSLQLHGLQAAHGEVVIDDLHWSEGRVDQLTGRVDLRDGRLSRPVVYGMCRWLAMEPFDTLEERYADPAQHAWFDFTQLACDVELDAEGLVLVAGCGQVDGAPRGGAVAHAVLEHNGQALLREPLQRPLPAQRLVQAWFPDDPAELPATPAAIEMARTLPGGSERN